MISFRGFKLIDSSTIIELNKLAKCSVDSIITDVSNVIVYDSLICSEDTWQKCLDVIKDGGNLLVFCSVKNYHKITCIIEDAGFEIRDCIMWLHSKKYLDIDSCFNPICEPIIMARKPIQRKFS